MSAAIATPGGVSVLTTTGQAGWNHPSALILLAALAVYPYLWAVDLPLISDDYEQIYRARLYGPITGWRHLLADPLYRSRATSLLLTYWTEQAFRTQPEVLNLSSLALHVLNTWLLYALCLLIPLGPRLAAAGAGSFAVHHAHQEAVTWYAAVPELLVFLFAVAALLAWLLHLRDSLRRYYWAALAFFVLALASKESAVAIAPLLLLLARARGVNWRSCCLRVAPFAILAAVYGWLIFRSSPQHQHLNDGTFSWEAPFAATLVYSVARLFWVTGLASLLVIWRLKLLEREQRMVLGYALVWIATALLPYSFLTYMPFVPSRHTYLASAGVALVVGLALVGLYQVYGRSRVWIPAAFMSFIVLGNCAYLVLKKGPQMRSRAEPTEALLKLVSQSDFPVHVHCFPFAPTVAFQAVDIRLRLLPERIRWAPDRMPRDPNAPMFCWYHGMTRSQGGRLQPAAGEAHD